MLQRAGSRTSDGCRRRGEISKYECSKNYKGGGGRRVKSVDDINELYRIGNTPWGIIEIQGRATPHVEMSLEEKQHQKWGHIIMFSIGDHINVF